MVLPSLGAFVCRRALCVAAVVLLTSSCGGGGGGRGGGDGGNPPAPPPGGPVDFALLQSTIFTPICTACHAGGAAPLGLRLEAGVSYAMLVNVPSVEVPSLLRVAPGNPDASYLVHKIEGRAAVGERMPLGGPPLPQTSIDNVRQWISAGALQAAVRSADSTPTRIVATAPIDGEALDAPLGRLLVVASRPLDTSLLSSATVQLRRVAAPGQDSPDDSIPVPLRSIRAPLHDASSVWIETVVPLGAGEYELQMRAGGAIAIADLAGNPLDGDGDGVAGGDLRLRFSVTEPAQ
jgi:hypothetical protein